MRLTNIEKENIKKNGITIKELFAQEQSKERDADLAKEFLKVSSVIEISEDLPKEVNEILELNEKQKEEIFNILTKLPQDELLDYIEE
jgi:hypothetical protein